jgi:sugar/nucleoside kinase (ribokinase family)
VLSIPRTAETREHVVRAAKLFHEKLKEGCPASAPAVVLRAGPLGSYTISEKWSGWVPAFWRKDEQARVVDVTGGGNSFLGGLCAGLLISDGDCRTGGCVRRARLTGSQHLRFDCCVVRDTATRTAENQRLLAGRTLE